MTTTGADIIAKARSYIGKLEDGPDVPKMAREIGQAFPEFAIYATEATNAMPWCGDFVAYVLMQFGIKPPPVKDGVGFFYVDRWEDFGTPIPVGQEQPGDIAGFVYPPDLHHVTFVAGRGQYVGGNQHDAVTETHFSATPSFIRRAPIAGVVDLHPEIKLGATGAPVIELQRLLGLAQSGTFDSATDAAVRAYQAAHGLDVDGEVGTDTWGSLLSGKPASPGSFPYSSKGSWYSQFDGKHRWRDSGDAPGSAALGVPDDAQGIAQPSRATLGKWFEVRAPNGVISLEQQTDLGPATFTGRTIDISAAAGERFGYSPDNFPTDAIFSWRPAEVPHEVAGLSLQEQATRYRDLRGKIKPLDPPVVVKPPSRPTKVDAVLDQLRPILEKAMLPTTQDDAEFFRRMDAYLAAKKLTQPVVTPAPTIGDLGALLQGKKTYISLGLLIAVCTAEYFGIDVVPGIDKDNAVLTAWGALSGMFMRAGISSTITQVMGKFLTNYLQQQQQKLNQ